MRSTRRYSFWPSGLRKPELYLDDPFHGLKIGFREFTDDIGKPLFADGGNLVGHGFVLPIIQGDIRFTRIESINTAREGNDLDTIQEAVRNIVADDHGWPLFLDLTTKRRVKVHPPDLTAFHVRCLLLRPHSKPRRPLHAFRPLPLRHIRPLTR